MPPTGAMTASRPLHVGIVGGGFMAEVHCKAARAAGANIVGIAASSPASASCAKSRLGLSRAYASSEDLLADDSIDVVHVCTPNATHSPIATAALLRGKHVVCEKPLATNAKDASDLVQLASRSGAVATIPFIYRFHPMAREARDRIASGETGEIRTIQGSYLQDWLLSRADDNWRVDIAVGGPSRAFADIGSHLCDLIEFISGDRIVRVSALSRTVFSDRAKRSCIQTEDLLAAVFETRNGAVGNLLVSQVAPGRKNRLVVEFSGSESTLQFDQETPETLWVGKRAGSQLLVRDPDALTPNAARLSVLPAGHPQGYQDAFNAFVADTYAAVRGQEFEGLPRFWDGLRAAVLTECVMESSRSAHWIDVPLLAQMEGAQV